MPRPRTAGDYQDGITTASRAGLAEIMTALGAYRDALVLIGGWAPYLIFERFGEQGGVLGAFRLDVLSQPRHRLCREPLRAASGRHRQDLDLDVGRGRDRAVEGSANLEGRADARWIGQTG